MKEKGDFPFPACLGPTPSFGFGDRIGLATPGHVEAVRRAGGGIAPVFAQQSAREMERTGRSPEGVMDAARAGLAEAGWKGAFGADADHLKSFEDIERTAAAGFTFFTLDPSDYVDDAAGTYPPDLLEKRFRQVEEDAPWFGRYLGKRIVLDTGRKVEFDRVSLMRTAVKYGLALKRALELARRLRRVQEEAGRDFEIELSVDETEEPTSLVEHYVFAEQLLEKGVELVSLAPRFPGRLEKGVDYIGPVSLFEESVRDHRAVAERLGSYKLSLHSGSDKLSVYPALARASKGAFHVKTAGTSYLEALRVAARHEPLFFREIVSYARERYEEDRATYHVHASLEEIPPPGEIGDGRLLEKIYLGRWEEVPRGIGFTQAGRQILHCTYGSVLSHPELGQRLRDLLVERADAYREVLALHFTRHLEALRAGMP